MFRGLLPPMHLLVILVIVLIIFGPGKLPELEGSIGKAIRGFKKAKRRLWFERGRLWSSPACLR